MGLFGFTTQNLSINVLVQVGFPQVYFGLGTKPVNLSFYSVFCSYDIAEQVRIKAANIFR